MSKKRTKIVKRNQFTAVERDEHLRHLVFQGFNTMHICFHSGSPDAGLLVGRSVFPLLVSMIHRQMTSRPHSGQSMDQMLEDLYSQKIVDECTHLSLRRAAAALSGYGGGRDLGDVIAACESLKRIIKSDAFKNASAVRRQAKAKKATDKRPALMRWASAAVGLFAIGSQS